MAEASDRARKLALEIRLLTAERMLRRKGITAKSRECLISEIECFGLSNVMTLAKREIYYRRTMSRNLSFWKRVKLVKEQARLNSICILNKYIKRDCRYLEDQCLNALSLHRVLQWKNRVVKDHILLGKLYGQQGDLVRNQRLVRQGDAVRKGSINRVYEQIHQHNPW